MNKLPLTNIEIFEKIIFIHGEFDTPFEFKEYLYVQINETLHGYYKDKYEEDEGIQITWKNNPFDIHFNDDNYLILTKKLK